MARSLRNSQLKKEDAFLKECLAKYGNPKDSRNCCTPPSKDENRPKANQSLRKSSGKSVGGQKGREGKTLAMNGTPDKIVELRLLQRFFTSIIFIIK